MKLKKTAIATTLTATLGIATSVSADTISMSFNGKFTLLDGLGASLYNEDANNTNNGNEDYGYRVAITGTGSFDTGSGAGTAIINPFSFYGGGLATFTAVAFQAIGDGMGGQGSLVASSMNFDWNGALAPATAVFDAAGFFGSIGAVGTTWTVGAGCAGCATSATSDYTIPSPFGDFVGVLGDGPMVMTSFNTAGTTLDTLFPLTDDGIAGSPATTPPFPDWSFGVDFTSITATNVPQVPVPAAAWLFGSGLLGLVGVARRRRQS